MEDMRQKIYTIMCSRPTSVRGDTSNFGGRSFDFINDDSMLEYQPTVAALFGAWGGAGENASEPVIVSDVIWQAATDDTDTLRYQAGEDAVALIAKRKIEGDATFIGDMKAQLGM